MKYSYIKLLTIGLLFSNVLFAQESQEVDRTKAPMAGPHKDIKIVNFNSIKADNGVSFTLVSRKNFPKYRLMINYNYPDRLFDNDKAKRDLVAQIISDAFDKDKESETYKSLKRNGVQVNSFYGEFTSYGFKDNFENVLALFSNYFGENIITKQSFQNAKEKLIANCKTPITKYSKKKFTYLTLKDSLSFRKEEKPEKIKVEKRDYEAISYDQIKTYFKKFRNRSNMNCILIGDFSKNDIKKLSSKYFSKAPKGKVFVKKEKKYKVTEFEPTQREIFVINKPKANQSSINFSWSIRDGYSYSDKEPYFFVMDEIFGKSYSSNLNKNLRLDKGLTYGIISLLTLNKFGGEYNTSVKVRTEVTSVAVENIIFEMLRMRDEKVTQNRIDMAIDKILGEYAISMSDVMSPSILGFAMQMKELKLNDDYLTSYPSKFTDITPNDINEYALKYIKPFHCLVFITGNAEELKKQNLEKFGKVTYFDEKGKVMKK